jgi:hypothetical protein
MDTELGAEMGFCWSVIWAIAARKTVKFTGKCDQICQIRPSDFQSQERHRYR